MNSPGMERFLAKIYVDAEARAKFLANPGAEAALAGLSDQQCRALENIDRVGLEMAAVSYERKRARKAIAGRSLVSRGSVPQNRERQRPAPSHYTGTVSLLRKLLSAVFLTGLALGQQGNPSAIETGQQLYRAHCFACHGQDGESISGVNLRAGQFRRAASDEELSRLINTGIPGTGMPPTNLTPAQRQALVAYIRSMHNTSAGAGPGDAIRGKAVFEDKGGCLGCHRVDGKGSRTGPDLTTVGSFGNPADLQRSILDPNATVLPQNRYVRAKTREGVVITGRRLNEDTHTIQLIDQNERLVSLSKSELLEFALVKTSPMPSFQGKLSSQEVADVVTYLLTLKGSQ